MPNPKPSKNQNIKTGLAGAVLFGAAVLAPLSGFDSITMGAAAASSRWREVLSLCYLLLYWAALLYALRKRDYGVLRAYHYYSIATLALILYYPLIFACAVGPFQPVLSAAERLFLKGVPGKYNFLVSGGLALTLVSVLLSTVSFTRLKKRIRLENETEIEAENENNLENIEKFEMHIDISYEEELP